MAQYITNPTAVMISDLHVGDPNNNELEDFDRDQDFTRLLLEVIPKRAGWPSTLILGGDFIDFPQVLPEYGKHELGDKYGVTEDQSLQKINRVIEGHPGVFKAIEQYINKGGHVVVLPGNHDIDFHWPKVFEVFRNAVGGANAPRVSFIKEGAIDEQGVYIEHGNQYSFDNRFEHWSHPIITAPDGSVRLERPWGTLFMDMVYNGIEELYPFVNKVHPSTTLALIALRSFNNKENVSVKVIAQLVAFFLTKGKRFSWGRLMGDQVITAPESNISVKDVEDFVNEIDGGINVARRAEIVSETTRLLLLDEVISYENKDSPLPGLMGRDDESGMLKRQNELLVSGRVKLIAFGHTHVPVDGNSNPPWGLEDSRRVFNTGSWMPRITIGRNESPVWTDLVRRKTSHDIRYLVIEFRSSPVGRLEPLLPPDVT
jgi:UDP-2,3-diacylglucosamine pyrophosphatase LpxH